MTPQHNTYLRDNTYHITTEDDKRGAGGGGIMGRIIRINSSPGKQLFVVPVSSSFTILLLSSHLVKLLLLLLEQDVHPLPCRLLLLLLVAWPFHNVTASESQCARVPICKSCSHLCACWLPLQSLSFSHNCCCW